MKQRFFIFMGVILMVVLTIQLVSCSNNEQDEISFNGLQTENILQKYGEQHNLGLDYIKLDAEKVSGIYTKSRLDSVFEDLVVFQYGHDNAKGQLDKASAIKELAFNGTIPCLDRTRCDNIDGFTKQANAFALKVLKDCMVNIANYLDNVHEDEMFDNDNLLAELHTIIVNNYIVNVKKCNSDIDANALAQTLGVLYGSIEYWTNSDNVECWASINMQSDKIKPSAALYNAKSITRAQESNKKLSKSEWLQTVAAADAIGALAGGPAAVACSAGAALYFDVE